MWAVSLWEKRLLEPLILLGLKAIKSNGLAIVACLEVREGDKWN
jgi:hypothetical protein